MKLDDCVLVLPPVRLEDLPPDGVVGSFLGCAALRFASPSGPIAMFLHDLCVEDLDAVLAAQRRQAEAQLGEDYARRPFWWEAAP